MLSSTVKSQINSKLKNIYSKNFKNNDLKIFSGEIFEFCLLYTSDAADD